MKILLWHVRNFEIEVTDLANRPNGIKPEPVSDPITKIKDAVLAFITVEESDKTVNTIEVTREIKKMTDQIGVKEAIICPFAHLSNKLANPEDSLSILKEITENCMSQGLITTRVHFGSDKELLLDVYGHKGAVRFREF